LYSRAVIVLSWSCTEKEKEWVPPEMEDISEFVHKSVRCCCTILSRVIDGRKDRLECEDGEVQCDLCATSVVESEGQDDMQDDMDEVEALGVIQTQDSRIRKTLRSYLISFRPTA
jgi:hypothetical protein